MGRPTVASRLPGLDELVDDGETGLLVPAGDDGALADALARLLNDAALRERMGDAAARMARERYAVGPAMQRVMGIYDRVLGAARPGARA